jgi:hypothetical protein
MDAVITFVPLLHGSPHCLFQRYLSLFQTSCFLFLTSWSSYVQAEWGVALNKIQTAFWALLDALRQNQGFYFRRNRVHLLHSSLCRCCPDSSHQKSDDLPYKRVSVERRPLGQAQRAIVWDYLKRAFLTRAIANFQSADTFAVFSELSSRTRSSQ